MNKERELNILNGFKFPFQGLKPKRAWQAVYAQDNLLKAR